MRQFMLIAARADNGDSYETRVSSVQVALADAVSLAHYSFPSYSPVRTVTWTSKNGLFAAVGLSNEPAGFDLDISMAPSPDSFLGVEGYLLDDVSEESLRYSHNLLEESRALGGCFSIFRANDHGIECITDHAGTGNSCYTFSRRLRIISNRSLWAHILAESDNSAQPNPVLQFDPVAVRNLVNSGSVQGNRTLFQGVTMMKRRSSHFAHPWGVRERTLESPILDADENRRPTSDELESICTSLVDAFSPLSGSSLSLALTGGRDSRMLLAAAQHVSGLELRTETTGEPDHPDVYIASDLAAALGVPHTRRAPLRAAPAVLLSEALEPRIKRVLDGHDWNLSAWDDMPDYGPFSPHPTMSGVGGEGLRGGMIQAGMVSMDATKVAAGLRNLQAGSKNLFRAEVNAAVVPDGYFWEEKALFNPYEAADRYYKDERSNRWATSRRAAARLRTNAIDPLFDNRFIDRFNEIPAAYRWTERLAYDIIKRLAPAIADFPIEGHPWKFDAQQDLRSGTPNQARKAVRGDNNTGVKPWKSLDAPSLRESMRTFILNRLNGAALNVLNPKGIEELLAAPKFTRPALIWNIATAVEVLSTRSVVVRRQPRRESIEVSDAPGLAQASPKSSSGNHLTDETLLELGTVEFENGTVKVPWRSSAVSQVLEFNVPQWTNIHYPLLSVAIATLVPKNISKVRYGWMLSSAFKSRLENATGIKWEGETTETQEKQFEKLSNGTFSSLNYTGGLDSSVARMLDPEFEYLNYLDLGQNTIEQEHARFTSETQIVRTNAGELSLMGSHWASIGIASILLAHHQQTSTTSFGTLAESSAWNFRIGDDAHLNTPPILRLVGLNVRNPLAGITEVGLLKLIANNPSKDSSRVLKRLFSSSGFQDERRQVILSTLDNDSTNGSLTGRSIRSTVANNVPPKWGESLSHDLLGLYIYHQIGREAGRHFLADVPVEVLDEVSKLSMDFMCKINTSIYASYPEEYTTTILENAWQYGLQPYSDLDKNDFRRFQEILSHHFPESLRSS